MAELSRREVLKYAGLAAAVSLSGVSALASEPEYIEPEKARILGKMMQGVVSQKEEYQKMTQLSYDSMTLMRAMIHDKHLWDNALPGQNYVVGVAEGRELGILMGRKHYFSNGKECGEFIKQCAKEGKAFHCDSRNTNYFI